MPLSPWSTFLKQCQGCWQMPLSPCSHFLNKVKAVDKCHFHLESVCLPRSRLLTNATFTLKRFKQGQGCWQMPVSHWSHFFKTRSRMLTNATFTLKPFLNKVKDVGKCHFHLEAILLTRSKMLTNATFTFEPHCCK